MLFLLDVNYWKQGMYGRATTAPPEAILKPSLYPGSCWPMAGDKGQVTLRLPYPVKVKAVTLDHAPSLLFEDPTKRESAPKQVRVFGFPPCWTKKGTKDVKKSDYLDEDDEDDSDYYRGICDDGLDFDVTKPVVLHDFEYDLEGPTIQTFHIPLPEDDEGEDEASCSETAATCGGSLDGGPNDILFSAPDRSDSIMDGMSAIRMQVTDNWGNKDYTCIYRFRIHGDPVDVREN
jgi:SUN domain-containing protein 1/2